MNTNAEATLQAWLAREAEVRATQLPPGVASMDEIRQRTGLELLQGLMSGGIPSVAMAAGFPACSIPPSLARYKA